MPHTRHILLFRLTFRHGVLAPLRGFEGQRHYNHAAGGISRRYRFCLRVVAGARHMLSLCASGAGGQQAAGLIDHHNVLI